MGINISEVGAVETADKSLNMDKNKILVVDDHPLYLEGLSLILADLVDNSELLRAESVKQAVELLAQHPDCDWVFLDLNLPDGNGLEVLDYIQESALFAPVIMLSGLDNIAVVDKCLQRGANGFITKGARREQLEECISVVYRGATYLSYEVESQLKDYRENLLAEREAVAANISERQLEVLLLIVEGYSNAEIGSSLNISLSTVKGHIAALMAAFSTTNRTHCAAEARRLNLVPGTEVV